MASHYPEILINKYVWRQFELDSSRPLNQKYLSSFSYSSYNGVMPIFPVADTKAGDSAWGTKTYIIYDSFMKARSTNKYFYPVKTAQMMYSIKGSLSQIFQWRDYIANILDREDVSANDINEYAGETLGNDTIFFHCTNASQVNYIANTTETDGSNSLYSTNLVIKFDYHITNIYNNA